VPEDLRDLIKRADSASRASQDAERLYIEAGHKLALLKAQYAIGRLRSASHCGGPHSSKRVSASAKAAPMN
jgi:hypothetical protein